MVLEIKNFIMKNLQAFKYENCVYSLEKYI